jgi:hypothetical protein
MPTPRNTKLKTTPLLPAYFFDRPYDFCLPTVEELAPFIGKKWVVGRNTARMRANYPNSNIVSRKTYDKAKASALAARGWSRYAEKVIRDLIADLEDMHERMAADMKYRPDVTVIDAARAALAKAG